MTVYSPAQSPAVSTSLKVIAKSLPQASVAEAIAKTGIVGHSMVVGAGNDAKTGASTSTT